MNSPGFHSTATYGPGAHDGRVVLEEALGLGVADLVERVALPDVLGQDRHVGLGEQRRRELGRGHEGQVVRALDGLEAGVREVRLEVAGADVARLRRHRVEHQLVRPAGVLAGRGLAVRPLHVGADLEGVGHGVRARLPALREARDGLQVLAEAHEQVVVEREDLVVRDRDRVPRVERLELLVRPGTQDQGLVALGRLDGRRCEQGRHDRGDGGKPCEPQAGRLGHQGISSSINRPSLLRDSRARFRRRVCAERGTPDDAPATAIGYGPSGGTDPGRGSGRARADDRLDDEAPDGPGSRRIGRSIRNPPSSGSDGDDAVHDPLRHDPPEHARELVGVRRAEERRGRPGAPGARPRRSRGPASACTGRSS